MTEYQKKSWYNPKPKKIKWYDLNEKMPVAHDLVIVQSDSGKEVSAWWTLQNWEGIRLKKDDTVVKWCRYAEHPNS